MARIRQRPMGKIIRLGGVGRIVRRAKLMPGVQERPAAKQIWRIR